MFLRSIWNPNAFKYTIYTLLDAYKYMICMIFLWVFIRFLIKVFYEILKTIKENKKDKNSFIKFLYKFFKNIKENWKNKNKLLVKNNIKEIFSKEKHIFKVLKYPIIWSILVWTCWMQVSLLYWLFWKYNDTQFDIIREDLPIQENWVLWIRATYSFCFFIIAWCFVWLSFWNKALRNIWIIIYAMWILFILLGCFLYNWNISNGLSNFIV